MIAIVVPILSVSAVSASAGGAAVSKRILKKQQPFSPGAEPCLYLSYSRCHSRSPCLLVLAEITAAIQGASAGTPLRSVPFAHVPALNRYTLYDTDALAIGQCISCEKRLKSLLSFTASRTPASRSDACPACGKFLRPRPRGSQKSAPHTP